MPIYEYQCEKCQGVFEAIQKFSDEPLAECRLCGEQGVRKLLSAPAFRLKGGGWYETDFKSGKQRNVAKSDTDSGSGSSGGSSSGATSSAAKGESKSSSDAPKKSEGGKKPDAA